MEGSTIANSQIFPTDKTASAVPDVAWETDRRKKLIANRPRLADVKTPYGTEGTIRSVR